MIIISSLSSCSFHGLPFRLLGATLQVPVDAISALILVVERASHFRDLPKLYGVCMLHCWVPSANIVLPLPSRTRHHIDQVTSAACHSHLYYDSLIQRVR